MVLGLMTTGKTTIGGRLANALGCPFSDSDETLSAGGGPPAVRRAEQDGLGSLHADEYRVLTAALAATEPVVVTGAGSVLDHPDLATRLSDALVIGLVAPEAVMRGRFRGSDHRPPLGADPIGSPELRADRLKALERVCDVVVTTHDRSVLEIVEELATWVEQRRRDRGPVGQPPEESGTCSSKTVIAPE